MTQQRASRMSMTDAIIVAREDIRTADDTTVREAVCGSHGEDVEFLGGRSPFGSDAADQPETALAEWSE